MEDTNKKRGYREDLEKKYGCMFDKKYKNKGKSRWIFMRRNLMSAIIVLDAIHGIDFLDITTFLFHITKDSGASKDILAKVSAEIELASANEERFIKGYHEFLKQLTSQYRKSGNYLSYFQALDYVQRYLYLGDNAISEQEKEIGYAICDILMQGCGYFTKNEFDVNNMIVGLSMDGTPIEIRDKFPLIDASSYYIQAYIQRGIDLDTGKKVDTSPEACLAAIHKYYTQYGYPNVNDYIDVVQLSTQNQIYNNGIINCIPFVNEYTFDMLPQHPFSGTIYEKELFPAALYNDFSEKILVRTLHHRRRTLPANGAIVKITAKEPATSEYTTLKIHLKETFVEKEMVCIFNVDTEIGDFCGYYNTATEWLYSPLNGSSGQNLHEYLKKLILWIYAAYVCDLTEVLPTEKSFRQNFKYLKDKDILSVNFMTIGSKEINHLLKTNTTEDKFVQFDRDKYESTERNINGFIRHLSAGQKASERAISLAESYGFELAADETFVQPFVRRQWVCK